MSDEENIETPAMTEEGADSVANPTFHSLPRGGKAFSAKARGKQREMEQPSEENSSPELALASSPEPSLPDPPSPIFAGLYAELEDAREAEGKIPGSPAAELPGAASTPLLPAAPSWLSSSSRAIVPKAERLEELTIKEPRHEVAIFRTRIETLSECSDTVENQAWNDGFRGVAIRPEQDEPPPHEDQNIEHYRERIQDFPARLEAVRDEGTAAGAADKEAELRVQIEFDSTRRDRSAAEVVAAYEGELAELRAKTTKVHTLLFIPPKPIEGGSWELLHPL